MNFHALGVTYCQAKAGKILWREKPEEAKQKV